MSHDVTATAYQSPLADTRPASPVSESSVDMKMIKKFREQIHALGALWIIIGAILLVLTGGGIYVVYSEGNGQLVNGSRVMMALLEGFGWALLGVLACRKRMAAVYVGLGMCYTSLLLTVLSENRGFGIFEVMMVVAILQAHRLIRWSGKIKKAGIPLTTKVETCS